MIAFLTGTPLLHGTNLIVVVNGVGYGVNVGSTTLSWAQQQSSISLYIHTHVREDQLELFGFKTPADQELFQLLLSVSGVGPKTALGLSELGSDALIRAVQTAEVATFTSMPRVGKKLAQKIIIELKSKLGSIQELYLGSSNPQEQDTVEALLALGFAEQDVQKVRTQLDWTLTQESSEYVKQALKLLGSKHV